MNVFIFMYHHIDDIIFRGRNKRYGAYNLRATYDLRLARAMFFSFSTFILIVCSPFLFARKFKVFEIWPDVPKDTMEVIITFENTKIDRIAGIQRGRTPPAHNSIPNPEDFYISNYEPDTPVNEDVFINSSDSEGDSTDESDVYGSETGELNGTANGVQGSQGNSTDGIVEKEKVEEVFINVEQMPVFGTGMNDLFTYLSREIKYPAIARENGITGTVVIQFVIDRNGKVTQVQLVKGIGGGCDQEALRVVKGMPNWTPGKQQGRAVSVKYTLPVKFKLQS